MKRAFALCGTLLLMVCMAVCFTQTAFAGSENEAFKCVNHKGYNTMAPENTLPAFELSAEMGYQYVETDISFTKDGVPVLLHNSNINVMARNPDGSELAQEDIEIGALTYEEALQYDFTKGMTACKGTKIARLDDFLDLCRTKSLHPYLELKNNGDYKRDQISGLVKLVREKGMEGKVSWISFEAKYLKWVGEEDPKARLGFLSIVSDEEAMKESVEAAKDLKTGENEVFLDLANKTEFVTYDYSLCEKEGLPVEIWVNDELNEFMGITERDVLETLDPYVTGATVDRYVYAKPVIELSPGSFIYNGEVQKPAVTVSVNGEKLKEGDCELTWPEGCSDAGTYQVTARLRKGILAGADTAEFVIMESDNK
jgi:glycerophosphoryl diester phosphodiesterase